MSCRFGFLSNQSCPWVGTLKWPAGTCGLSLSWVCLPFSPFSPRLDPWIPSPPCLPQFPSVFSSPFPLLLPLPCSHLELEYRQKSQWLPCQGPLPEKWNRSNYKKRMKKERSLAKWGKQMFRSGFAVSGCQLKHLPYRIAICRHSSSCHMCGCFKIKSVYVYALVSAWFSSPRHLCSPKSRIGKITDHLVARFIFTLFSEGASFFLEGALENFLVSIYRFFNWNIGDLLCCVGFRCTSQWFSALLLSLSTSLIYYTYIIFQILFPYRYYKILNSLCYIQLAFIGYMSYIQWCV